MNYRTIALCVLLPLVAFADPQSDRVLEENNTSSIQIQPNDSENIDAEEEGAAAITLTSLDEQEDRKNIIPFDELHTFVDVFDNIKKNYVEETSNKELIENAISGMVSRLDPHSVFLNAEEYQEFKDHADGEYEGIGIVVDLRDGAIKVISAIAGSPAQKAGIKSGDIIATINNQSVQDISLQEAVNLIEGKAETSLSLGILRDDTLLEFDLTRQMIQTNSVSAKLISPGIVYVKISQFQEDTAESLQKAITGFMSGQPIKGLIMDLRDDPGGYMQSAVDSADLFLDQGNILSVKNRQKMEQQRFDATPGDILNAAPIVILVNRGTASSAEILTAALQENERAIVVGSQTFGKGSVQTIFPLYSGGAIKLTTARYYTPHGNLIQARGIRPNILLTPLKANIEKTENISSEASLYRHLRNEQPKKDTDIKFAQTDLEKIATTDLMLYESYNILQTLIFTQGGKSPAS